LVRKGPDGSVESRTLSDVRFVPLIGEFGFAGDPTP